jgi:hypothetical protein
MKWSEEEVFYLKSNFGKENAREIAKKLNRGYDGVHKKAQSLGLVGDKGINRKFTLNHDFFENPNAINSYWAGFIAADGCITSGYLKIMIHIKDLAILEKFKEDCGYTGSIYVDKKRDRCSIEIRSKKMIKDLEEKWSIVKRKSLILLPPKTDLCDNDFFTFVRGYIDGDGSIYFEPKDYLRISMIGTEKFLLWIKNRFSIKSSKVTKNKNIFKLRYSGKNAYLLFEKLVAVKCFVLSRKWVLTGYNPHDKIDVGSVTV